MGVSLALYPFDDVVTRVRVEEDPHPGDEKDSFWTPFNNKFIVLNKSSLLHTILNITSEKLNNHDLLALLVLVRTSN